MRREVRSCLQTLGLERLPRCDWARSLVVVTLAMVWNQAVGNATLQLAHPLIEILPIR